MKLCLHSAERDLSWDGALSGSCLGSFVLTYISDFLPCWVGRVNNQGSFPAHLWGVGCGGCNSSDGLGIFISPATPTDWLELPSSVAISGSLNFLPGIHPPQRNCSGRQRVQAAAPSRLEPRTNSETFTVFCWLNLTEGSPDQCREHRSCLPARGISIGLWPPYFFQGHVTLQTQRSFDVVEAFHGRKVAQTLWSLIMDLVPFTGDRDAYMTSAWELYRLGSRFWPHSSLQVSL